MGEVLCIRYAGMPRFAVSHCDLLTVSTALHPNYVACTLPAQNYFFWSMNGVVYCEASCVIQSGLNVEG